jgi:ethanolamine ammonia-lyase small subunit
MTEARRRGLSGVQLKDEAETLSVEVTSGQKNFLIESR